ncbi:hypothetical protein CRE_20411 [Caenorhabditis remanei]|uniref:Uncharacterized protein n=1 Tax=Caenorhabditis remanei TaxID=31234 RepID=E3MT74_CAERE|nr:hypothetical protein CRE_20411 [Caenorhabditis remanei]
MFRAIFDAFNFTSTTTEDSEDVPSDTQTQNENIDEDGWVNFTHPEDGDDTFAIVENPEIMEMDEMTMDDEIETGTTLGRPELEAIKRREKLNLAKAKTAFRNHLESVMFADPKSGKDVRTTKTTHGSTHSGVSNSSNSIRRLNTQSQRSKKSSGKSNDRKTHRVSDLQLTEA